MHRRLPDHIGLAAIAGESCKPRGYIGLLRRENAAARRDRCGAAFGRGPARSTGARLSNDLERPPMEASVHAGHQRSGIGPWASALTMTTSDKIEFGDFQTPSALASEVCALVRRLGEDPQVIVEPTAGRGAFLVAAARTYPGAKLRGWEINGEYVREATMALAAADADARSSVVVQDFFTCDWEKVLSAQTGRLLILGNPPWVTNAGVSSIDGANLPTKENFMGLRGIAALTGKSNFDISEWMLIRLLRALHTRTASLAMLCKSACPMESRSIWTAPLRSLSGRRADGRPPGILRRCMLLSLLRQ